VCTLPDEHSAIADNLGAALGADFPDALAVWRNRVADLFSELLLRK